MTGIDQKRVRQGRRGFLSGLSGIVVLTEATTIPDAPTAF
jgi:hypothetical protein